MLATAEDGPQDFKPAQASDPLAQGVKLQLGPLLAREDP